MKKFVLSISLLLAFISVMAQDKNALPFSEIPSAPETYSDTNVAARMIDGLGYRYYWATEGLRESDLKFKPSKDARSTDETIDHLYGLSLTILNAPTATPNIRPLDFSGLTFNEKSRKTLENFEQASILLKSGEVKLEDALVIFQRGESKPSFPFWNMINGPIADAIYHTGQVVSFRRSAGNPMNPNVNVFRGRNN